MLKQSGCVNEEGSRAADLSAAVIGVRQVGADDASEEPVRPVGVSSLTGSIDFLHSPPHPRSVFVNGNLVLRDALIRNVDDVLGVVEEGHVVVIAAEQKDLAAGVDESLERRAGAERIIPRLTDDEVVG